MHAVHQECSHAGQQPQHCPDWASNGCNSTGVFCPALAWVQQPLLPLVLTCSQLQHCTFAGYQWRWVAVHGNCIVNPDSFHAPCAAPHAPSVAKCDIAELQMQMQMQMRQAKATPQSSSCDWSTVPAASDNNQLVPEGVVGISAGMVGIPNNAPKQYSPGKGVPGVAPQQPCPVSSCHGSYHGSCYRGSSCSLCPHARPCQSSRRYNIFVVPAKPAAKPAATRLPHAWSDRAAGVAAANLTNNSAGQLTLLSMREKLATMLQAKKSDQAHIKDHKDVGL